MQRTDQRRIRNFLLRPDLQLKYSFAFVGIMLAMMCVIFLTFLSIFDAAILNVSRLQPIDPDLIEALRQPVNVAMFTTIAITAVFTAVTVALGIVLTHRIIGPMIPILRVIHHLKKKEYGVQASLRTKDSYQEVMTELNELSKLLAERHQEQETQPKV